MSVSKTLLSPRNKVNTRVRTRTEHGITIRSFCGTRVKAPPRRLNEFQIKSTNNSRKYSAGQPSESINFTFPVRAFKSLCNIAINFGQAFLLRAKNFHPRIESSPRNSSTSFILQMHFRSFTSRFVASETFGIHRGHRCEAAFTIL